MVSGNGIDGFDLWHKGHVTTPNKIIRSGEPDPANEQQISIPITNIHDVNVQKAWIKLSAWSFEQKYQEIALRIFRCATFAQYCNSKYYVENFDFSLLLLDIHDQNVWLQPVKAFCMKFWAEISRNRVAHFSENSMLSANCFKSKYYAEMFAVASSIVDFRPSLVFQHRCMQLGCLLRALSAGYLPSRTYEFIHLTCVLPGRTYELVFWKYFFFFFFSSIL